MHYYHPTKFLDYDPHKNGYNILKCALNFKFPKYYHPTNLMVALG